MRILKPLVLALVVALLVGVLWSAPGGRAAGNVITSPDTAGFVGAFSSLTQSTRSPSPLMEKDSIM